MPFSNRACIESLYTSLARGDAPAAFARMDAEIVWYEAENFPYSDRNPYLGPAAVAEGVFHRLATDWDSFQAIPDEFLDAGDTIVVTGRYRATYKATGIALDAQFAHIWRLRDGKVTAFQQYTDTAQANRVVAG